MTNTFTLSYGGESIPYDVTPDPNRTSRVAIHVNPDGSVSVDAPPNHPEGNIRQAVQKRARWIANHVADARQRYAHVRPREYVSGEQVLYLGRRYVLKVKRVDGAPGPGRLKGNRLEVETRTGDPQDIQGRARGWYRVKARDYFARRLVDFSKRLQWVDDVPEFRLLVMSRQWGSCSAQGQVILNPHLVKAPRHCIDYVLIHELAHLKHHNHGSQFWDLIHTHVPEWRKAKHHLDGLVEVLLVD